MRIGHGALYWRVMLAHSLRLALVLLVAAGSPLLAAITLNDAFKAAVDKTETVPIQQSEVIQAQERVTTGVGRVLPNLSFQASYLRQEAPDTGTNAFNRPDQSAAKFTLVQPLFHGFADWAELRSRRLLVEAATRTVDSARLSVYGNVADAYYNVLAAERDLADLKALLGLSDQRVEELKGRVRIGRSRRGELLTAESQVAAVKAQVAQAEGVVATSREAFALATNLSTAAALADDTRELPADIPALSTYLARVPERPDILAQQSRLESTREQINVAEAGHWPGLDLTGNYYLKRTGILDNVHWDVGVQLVVPLFAGGAIQSQVREVVERRKEVELQLELLKRQAAKDVATFHASVVSGTAQFRSLEDAYQKADANYREQTRDYRFGLVTNLEVIQALNSAYDSKRALSRTRYGVLASWEKLQAAVGKLPGG